MVKKYLDKDSSFQLSVPDKTPAEDLEQAFTNTNNQSKKWPQYE